jgi:aspartate 1-decarboxylase
VLNGGAARLGEKGDLIIVMSTVLLDDTAARSHRLKCFNVDRHNRIVSDRHRSRGR